MNNNSENKKHRKATKKDIFIALLVVGPMFGAFAYLQIYFPGKADPIIASIVPALQEVTE